MFCSNCGKQVQTDKTFCGNCGTPVPPMSDEQPTQPTTFAAEQPTAPTQPLSPAQPSAPHMSAAPEDLVEPPFSLDFSESAGRRLGPIVLIIVLVLLIIAVGVTTILFILKDDKAGTALTTPPEVTTTLPGTETTTGPATTLAPEGVVDLVDLALRVSTVQASSVLPDQGSTTYDEGNLTDKDPATCWAEDVAGYGVGEYVEFTWASPVSIRQVRIVPGYDKAGGGWDRWTSNGRVRTFDLVFSDGTTESFTVTDTKALQVLELASQHTVTSLRFVISGIYEAAPGPHKAEDTSVSELHFWGAE